MRSKTTYMGRLLLSPRISTSQSKTRVQGRALHAPGLLFFISKLPFLPHFHLSSIAARPVRCLAQGMEFSPPSISEI